MATFDDLDVLKTAEAVADVIWKQVIQWDEFVKDTVGKQLTRAADSVGANIAESFGRYSFGEKLQFLYYARGSLFETKYWLNRVRTRGLLDPRDASGYAESLTSLARQLNAFASGLKAVRSEQTATKAVREPVVNMSSRLAKACLRKMTFTFSRANYQSPITTYPKEKP